ncbi:MAG TPA: hypothetical protein VH186_17480 [Chloroflexia bacterium]|nr:hypothetical protein [Chloroflexia bacterium]
MLELNAAQTVSLKTAPRHDVLLNEVCQAVKALDGVLEDFNFFKTLRTSDAANFHNADSSLPDLTLGELVTWTTTLACEEGPALLRQQPAGAALVAARARQINSLLRPISRRVDSIACSPHYHHNEPFLLMTLARPELYWAFDELCQKLDLLANR